ncbi:hypothetical protein Cpir12675_001836 [Ceratocystis pirilliformis]|uniref:F-box domain-containing protein n=1 Tax=Ceratocystis pirilliformis TaxID=259994 RepID=A0ABR3ZEL5_9PEZI
MATTKALLSDVISYPECSKDAGIVSPETPSYMDSTALSRPAKISDSASIAPTESAVLSGKPLKTANVSSPEASTMSLPLPDPRGSMPLSPKRQRSDSFDGDVSPVSAPKRRRIVSARLPTPSVSRRSSMNFVPINYSSSSICKSTIPRSFADIEAALAPLTSFPPCEPLKPIAFARLPRELNDMIFSLLDYKSLIRLSQTNTLLNSIVNTQIAPAHEKLAFVMSAEMHFSQHWPKCTDDEEHPGNFACYTCFRVRSPIHFAEAEPPHDVEAEFSGEEQKSLCNNKSPAQTKTVLLSVASKTANKPLCAIPPSNTSPSTSPIFLRRFCIDCGVRHGFYKAGQNLVTKLDQKLWICSCRRICQTASEPECPECQK